MWSFNDFIVIPSLFYLVCTTQLVNLLSGVILCSGFDCFVYEVFELHNKKIFVNIKNSDELLYRFEKYPFGQR